MRVFNTALSFFGLNLKCLGVCCQNSLSLLRNCDCKLHQRQVVSVQSRLKRSNTSVFYIYHITTSPVQLKLNISVACCSLLSFFMSVYTLKYMVQQSQKRLCYCSPKGLIWIYNKTRCGSG